MLPSGTTQHSHFSHTQPVESDACPIETWGVSLDVRGFPPDIPLFPAFSYVWLTKNQSCSIGDMKFYEATEPWNITVNQDKNQLWRSKKSALMSIAFWSWFYHGGFLFPLSNDRAPSPQADDQLLAPSDGRFLPGKLTLRAFHGWGTFSVSWSGWIIVIWKW